MVFASESGMGSTNQRFCLEPGILFAIPALEHGQGYYFAARIVLQMNVAVATWCRAACLLNHAVSDSKVNRVSHFSVWNRVSYFSQFCLEQCSKIVSL